MLMTTEPQTELQWKDDDETIVPFCAGRLLESLGARTTEQMDPRY